MPKSLRYALYAISAEFAIGIVMAIIDLTLGNITSGLFIATLVIFAILLPLPYKIYKRSNGSRYIWLAFSILSFLSVFWGTPTPAKHSDIGSWISLPISLFEIYWLFTRESNIWFGKKVIVYEA